MGTDASSVLKALLAVKTPLFIHLLLPITGPCLWPHFAVKCILTEPAQLIFSLHFCFLVWNKHSFEITVLWLYCSLIYSTCFYVAHDSVTTLTRRFRFTTWLISVPGLLQWCHSWEEILTAEQLQAAVHKNAGKGKQKLIFSPETTTVSNSPTNEMTCKHTRNKEPCKVPR